MAEKPGVSVLIVNWNGKDLLRECLDSVFSQTYENFEVVVVDNGSTDGSVDMVSRCYPQVKVVSLLGNQGFAGGNNRGLEFCTGEFLALVNNDVVLAPDWISQMVGPMESDPAVGLCSSRIFIKGTPRLDTIGDRFTTAFTGSKLGENEPGIDYDGPFSVDGVCAAAALYRRAMIDQIGFFDEDLFLNYEDTDLNLRAYLQGWRSVYVPVACSEHTVNATIGTMSRTSVFYFSRNSLLVLVKNVPLNLIVFRLPQRLLFELVAFLYYGILNRQLPAYLHGKLSALRMLPKMIKKRKNVVGSIRLTNGEILQGQLSIVLEVWKHLRRLVRRGR